MDHGALTAGIQWAEQQGMRIGCCIVPTRGEIFAHREHEIFRSASTIKLAILIAACRQADAGSLDWDQQTELTSEARVPGSGVLTHMTPGLRLPWRDVAYLMMSISDNTATNLLIDLVGIDAVNRTIVSLGATATHLRRPMRGRRAEFGEPENETTPYDMAVMLNAVLQGEACSSLQCEFIMSLLSTQQNDRRIGSAAPEDSRWGSKTGTLAGVVNDVGFISTSAGSVIITAFVDDAPDEATGEKIIAGLALAGISGDGSETERSTAGCPVGFH